MKKKILSTVIFALVAAAVVCALVAAGILRRLDKWAGDLLYARPGVSSGDVVIIGIDERALEQFGPYGGWDRNIVASALEALAADPDRIPAVVAVDTLYSGESASAEADERLARAAEKLGCVVTASAAEFGGQIEWIEGRATYDSYSILGYEGPYEKLASAATVGHINAMYDRDGVMRHAILYIEPEEGVRVYSMAREAARIYLEGRGKSVSDPPVNALGQFFVPFTTEPGGFYDGISIADLINGDVSPDYFSGKIVFIGPWATGLQDAYYTPSSRASQMYGVEFQANVTQSIIEENFKTEAPDPIQLVILFVVSFCAAFVYRRYRLAVSGVVCAALCGLGVAVPYLLYGAGIVTHPTWIPAAGLVLFVAAVAAHYISAALERQRITRTFERYVAPEIVGEILKEGTENLSLGGKLCNIAVLFVDLRGFTSMSEKMDPEKVVLILNRYLAMTSECIARNHGTLDKFIGDATMAFWGAPIPQEDPVGLAAKTALEIARGAAEVSKELSEEIGVGIRAGVGVHYGPAVVGNMGSERRMDYTAIGDTVNTASRLESNAPGGTVYISRAVADILGDRAKTTSLGSTVKLKGKDEGFEVLVLEELDGE